MKFLIVLALAVAASQAAFTGSLVDQTQPLIQGLKIQALAKSSVEAKFLSQLGAAIQQQVSNVVNTVSNVIGTVTNVAQTLQSAVGTASQQVGQIGQQVVQQAQIVLGQFISTMIGSLTKNNRALPAAVIQIIRDVVNSEYFPHIQAVVHNTQLYQCLTNDEHLEIEIGHLAELHYDDELLNSVIAALPAVERCVGIQGIGSIHDVLQPVVPFVVGLLHQFNAYDLVHNALVNILGDDLYAEWVAPLLAGSKGLIGNVISGVQNGANQLAQFIATAAQTAIAQLKPQIEKIKEVIIAFVNNGLQYAQQMTLEAAQNMVSALQSIKEELGPLYNQVIDTLASIHTSLVLPF